MPVQGAIVDTIELWIMLSVHTHKDVYISAANSGFPTMGFTVATFTVTGLPAGTTAAEA